MFSLRDKKKYLRIILNTPSYLELCVVTNILCFRGRLCTKCAGKGMDLRKTHGNL